MSGAWLRDHATAAASSSGGGFAETLAARATPGSGSRPHLDYYLDACTFRFNRRRFASRGKLFYRLVQQAVAVPPAPYKQLCGGNPKPLR